MTPRVFDRRARYLAICFAVGQCFARLHPGGRQRKGDCCHSRWAMIRVPLLTSCRTGSGRFCPAMRRSKHGWRRSFFIRRWAWNPISICRWTFAAPRSSSASGRPVRNPSLGRTGSCDVVIAKKSALLKAVRAGSSLRRQPPRGRDSAPPLGAQRLRISGYRWGVNKRERKRQVMSIPSEPWRLATVKKIAFAEEKLLFSTKWIRFLA